ncbi:formyltransferase family protein [Curvibacter sp. APW13]|uniref:formyltransferase family protein n=1 Tax=Curvibacter sp. APW13 TaxID=3077236 RepID=UPI0028DE42FE|nr:formyltransferase family protein [Curvibacter sp. APW13]MDT8993100.1 formyltransferase family protein [Curvibacter sp. APW13]
MEINPIVFFGSYLPVLKTFTCSMRVELVVLEARRNEGKTKDFCKANNIRWIEINGLDELDGVLDPALRPVGVVASFGLLFKKRHIDWFKSLFNFHPGCIYTNRGRHPLPNAILNGFKSMSLSVHQITDERIDAGRFVSRIEFSIDYASDYPQNYSRLLTALEFLAKDLCDGLGRGEVPAFDLSPQSGTYFGPLAADDLKKITEASSLKEWCR